MATVVKATEHVLVETATAVVSSLGAAATAEFKTLESGIAQEAVSATDDGVSNILHKVEGAVETVIEEVVNGAQHVVETVKQHPELIAEGALAVAIGAASLVQPELIAGEVAILGKMAADSAKKTVTQIASDEGEKIVKAISKDLAEDAKAEAEKDKLQAEEKKKAEGGEVVVDGEAAKVVVPEGAEVKPVVEGEKSIAIEIQKPAAKTEDGVKDAKMEKEVAPVELKITIGSDGEIKAVSKSVVEEATPVESTAEEKTAAPVATEKIEVPAVAKKEVPVPVNPETAAPVVEKTLDLAKELPVPAEPENSIPATEPKPVEAPPTKSESVVSQLEQIPVSTLVVKEVPVPITQEVVTAESKTLPTEVAPVLQKEPVKEEVKATELPVSKPVVETEKKSEPEPLVKAAEVLTTNENAPVEAIVSETKDFVEPEILSVLGITHTDAPEEKKEALTAEPEETESFVEQLLHRSNSGEPIVPVEKADEEESLPQSATVESVPEVKQEPTIIPCATEELKKEEPAAAPVQSEEIIAQPQISTQSEQVSSSSEPKSITPTEPAQQDAPELNSTPLEPNPTPTEHEQTPIPSALSQAKDLAVSALASSAAESGPNLVTAAPSVTNITTTTTKTVEAPSSSGVKMVTVSQESLDILHSKLDAMHEAIQLITKTLATHLPAPPAPAPVVLKEVETESTPIPVTQVISEAIAQTVSEPATQEPEIPAPIQPTSTASDEVTPVPTASTNPPETQPTTQSTTPKRPTHVKRGSVIGSIGKFLWPFGGSAPPSKDATVKVSTVEITGSGEVEVQEQMPKPRSSGRDSAPGLGVTKAVSTVEVTEVLATPVAV
ncbi:hypothetical protein DL98DRAFT_656454 [Cadophora sp. DSE1049]|nr:hypothetical protein DL98DRAFT_656454 [Cadophora sp. DSE1049]